MNDSSEKRLFLMPAEWEPHEATWITWPKDPLTWPDRLEAAREVYLKMMEILSSGEKVNLLVDDEETKQDVLKRLQKRKTPTHNIHFYCIPTVDSWIRDYGPIFVKPTIPLLCKEGLGEVEVNQNSKLPANLHPLQLPLTKGEKSLIILDFIFNAWGNKYEPLKVDDSIPQKIAPLLQLPRIEPGIVLEGGSIDVNGAASLLTTEQCLLNKNRNPSFSKPEIEKYLTRYLGATNILWLGDGIEGDDTDGHVDDITRFVSQDALVTAVEEDPEDPNYKPLQDNLKRLRSMKDESGHPFKIIPLPMPGRLEREDGSRLPASYANFYMANKVVLVPIYNHENDEKALRTLQKLFPERKVIGIDCRDLIWGMGALHCLTQQQPRIE